MGMLPELHYVVHVQIHVRPFEFVRRLHRYELGAKPAQLRSSARRNSVGFNDDASLWC